MGAIAITLFGPTPYRQRIKPTSRAAIRRRILLQAPSEDMWKVVRQERNITRKTSSSANPHLTMALPILTLRALGSKHPTRQDRRQYAANCAILWLFGSIRVLTDSVLTWRHRSLRTTKVRLRRASYGAKCASGKTKSILKRCLSLNGVTLR